MEYKFMGFYTMEPFWAEKKVDLSSPHSYRNAMEEHILNINNNALIAKISRDGMIELHIKSLEKEIKKRDDILNFENESFLWNKYLNYLNSFYILLDSTMCEIQNFSYFNIQELTASNIYRITYIDNKFSGSSIPHNNLTSAYYLARLLDINNFNPSFNLHFSHVFQRQIIYKNTLEATIEKFTIACENEYLINDLAQLSKSLAEFKNGNNELSLVISWFIVEKSIISLSKKRTEESNDCLKLTFLTNDKSAIKFKIDFLYYSKILNETIYKEIENIRKCRNKIVHQSNKNITSIKEASLAINVVEKLLLIQYNFSISCNTSLKLAGM